MEPVTTLADSRPPGGELYCPTCEKQFATGDRCPTDGTRLVKLATQVDPFIGRELDKRYTILEKLGQGGMGAVYRGSQHSVGRDCAIKVINPSLVSDAEVIKRFLREAKLASRLSHPNAVAVLDFGQTEDGVFYLAMELVNGRTLDQVFKAERTFKPERVVRIGAQVCDALEGAHALQIVHRDLKPSNIMLLSRGRDLIKVLDFGLAKSLAPDQTSTTMTNAGALLGTPAFMPPELALGEPCDGRADLYSLGCVLYLLGSGRLPFISSSAHELIAMHATEKVPPMTGVPPALARVIERMLEKDPNARYQNAADTREALEAAIDGRLYTPPAGVVLANETHPSIGPFPKTTEDLMLDDTLSPPPSATQRRALTSKQIDALVSSPTEAAVNDTMIHAPRPSAVEIGKPRPKWLLPAFAIGVLAIGGGVFALTRHSDDAPPPAPKAAPPPAAIVTPPPAPPPAPPPVEKPVDKVVETPTAPPQNAAKPPVDKHVKKTPPKTTPKSTTTTTTTTTTPPKPEEPPKTGSNKPALPF
jgi:serine/threonine-protein kinase